MSALANPLYYLSDKLRYFKTNLFAINFATLIIIKVMVTVTDSVWKTVNIILSSHGALCFFSKGVGCP